MSAIILTGFMGTGKTTVGRLLAARLHKAFVDIDERIEQAEGLSVAAIFASKGEPYFRALERRMVAEVTQMDAVIATGGGAIVDVENYARLHVAGPIICLRADVEAILERTAADTQRPLLNSSDRATRVRELLAQRAGAYGKADLTIDTTHRSTVAVLEEILTFLHGTPGQGGR